jgi:hypothetical protein
LGFLPAVLAHGIDNMDMDMSGGPEEAQPKSDSYPPTYFAHPEHRGVIHAHIGLMVFAWVVVLPVGKLPSPFRRAQRPSFSRD